MMYSRANAHRLIQKISRCPSLLLKVTLVSLWHMISEGSKAMFFITASMQGNALMRTIYFYMITIINSTDLFANELVRHTVVMIVFSQRDMIIFLHLGQYTVSYYKFFRWQWLQ